MKFTCQKTELVQAIQTVSKAASSKPQMPVLSGIYLKAEDGILELQATDYEIGILCQIEAEVETPGNIVLSGRYLQEVTRRLPGETVEIDFDRQEQIAHIRSNTANFTLLSMIMPFSVRRKTGNSCSGFSSRAGWKGWRKRSRKLWW